jgi:putative FmdB family regulatory protein
MPIYSYKCDNCGKLFDKFEQPGGTNKVICTDCNSEALRIFSPVGIVFKGKGFYSTDYGAASTKMASDGYSAKEKGNELKKEETVKKEEKPEGSTSETKSA